MKKTGLILLMAVMLVWLSGCVPPDSDEQAVKVPITNDVPAPEANPANPVVPEASTTVPDKAPTAPAEGTAHEQADSTTSPTLSWYFIRNDQHQMPGTNAEYKELLAQHQAFYILPNDRQNIYLTFDCGYELGYTSQILDTLAAQNVKAAFFIPDSILKPSLIWSDECMKKAIWSVTTALIIRISPLSARVSWSRKSPVWKAFIVT